MKTYELFLHFKQGDDLSAHVEATKNSAAAMRAWSVDFKHRAEICEQIARAIDGKDIEIAADVHFIAFEPKDKKARAVLDALVKENLLNAVEEG